MKKLFVLVAFLCGASSAQADDYQDLLNTIVEGPIASIVSNEAVWSAVIAQNEQTAGYDQAKIDELDQQWRAETKADSKPFIDEALARPLSKFLIGVQNNSGGNITEIFVVDAKGLNVGQSAETSDYWQGDEEKWDIPFNTGSVVIGEVEFDESTQQNQSQISVPVKDDSGNIVGTATFAVLFK